MAVQPQFIKKKLQADEINVHPQHIQDESSYLENYRQFKMESNELLQSQRKTFGIKRTDSSEMAAVKQSLSSLTNFLDTVMGPKEEAYETQLKQLQGIYVQMLNCCTAYIEKNLKPRTSTGKHRLQMVKLLYSQALRESNGLETAAANIYAQAGGDSILWANVLRDARSIYIDANFDNIAEVGNGTSEVYRFPVGNQNVYFKPLETVHKSGEAFGKAIDEYYQQSDDSSLEFAYNFIKEGSDSSFILDAIKLYSEKKHVKLSTLTQEQLNSLLSSDIMIPFKYIFDATPELCNINGFMKFYRLANIGVKAEGLAEVCHLAKISPGQQISQRNVATTRLAKLLGINELIAESRTAVVKWDEQNKQSGIIMREAEGTDRLKIEMQGLGMNGEAQIDTEYSPEVLRQLTILSLFDSLCGQIDRNPSNILLKTNDQNGKRIITKASGIDNDTAFGNLTFEEIKDGLKNTCKIVDNDGLYALPCIDKEFFERITAMTQEQVLYIFKDLISNANINFFIERMENIKTMLLATYQKRGNSFLVEKDQWENAGGQIAALGNKLSKISYLAPEFIKTQNAP